MRATIPAIALVLVLASGCSDEAKVPFARFWSGGFEGKPADSKIAMRKEWVYKGWLQVYIGGNKYKMHMESLGQIVDITGTWTHKQNKIYLTATNIDFDDRGGEIMRPAGVQPIPPEQVRDAYSRPMVLALSPDRRSLQGLDMSIGPLLGKHVFIKGGE